MSRTDQIVNAVFTFLVAVGIATSLYWIARIAAEGFRASVRRRSDRKVDAQQQVITQLTAELADARAVNARLSQDLNGVEALKTQVAKAQPHLGADAAHYISRSAEGGV